MISNKTYINHGKRQKQKIQGVHDGEHKKQQTKATE